MKNFHTNNPIILLGPSGVGKSLIGKNLSKSTMAPIICIDDLIQLIFLEQQGEINKSKTKQKEYALNTLAELKNHPQYQKNLQTDENLNKTFDLIANVIEEYNRYTSLIGPLKHYYKLLNENYALVDKCKSSADLIIALNDLSYKLITSINQKKLHSLIIDPPASFGWQLPSSLKTSSKIFTTKQIDELEENITTCLQNSTTILFTPGSDYNLRNPSSDIEENKLILQNLDNYYDSELEISTNSLFTEPQNPYLKKRSWFDAKEYLTKDKLLNKSEISNICYQIQNYLHNKENEKN